MGLSLQNKTYWLVGASEGLGRALAAELAGAGVRLCLSARNEGRLQGLAESLSHDPVVAPCDVRDTKSVAEAFGRLPPLDGVIMNAGVYEPVKATEWQPDMVEAMCDVNFTGAARVLGQAVPHLVSRGKGHIVVIGSLAGCRGMPGAIGYASSKAGVMHLAECVRVDLPSPDFCVQTVNPGFIETRLTAKNDFEMPYMMSPEDAAREVRKAMESGRFSTNFPGKFAWRFRIARHLPNWLYFRLVSSR
ncbi:MAG TPA: SDR family NAD(P)-dependent oxidoreductase [Alphaproteobacteria bacterium]|nr:SDR family NAD(P)-dependent oxidoreductase [Alphaproteobacteria bacterium]